MKLIEHGTAEWHAERAKRVGASEVATLLGISPYETPAEMWGRKKGLLPRFDGNDATDRGQFFEAPVAECWAKKTGTAIERVGTLAIDGSLCATRDYVRLEDGAPVEIKTTANGWSDSWWWQLQTQMLLTEAATGVVVWMDARMLPESAEYPADVEAQEKIRAEADKFVALLKEDAWPGWVPAKLAAKIIAPIAGKEVELSAEGIAAVETLKKLGETKTALTKTIEQLHDLLAWEMGDAETGTAHGFPIITWKAKAGAAKFDTKAFRAAHAALADEYTTRGKPTRTWRPL